MNANVSLDQTIQDAIGNAIANAFSQGMPERKCPNLETVSDAFLRSMPESEYDAAIAETERNAGTAIEIAEIIRRIVKQSARYYGVSID